VCECEREREKDEAVDARDVENEKLG